MTMRDRFLSLAQGAATRIAEMKRAGTLTPSEHPFLRFELSNFRYGADGPAWDEARWEWFLKDSWMGSALQRAIAEVATEIQHGLDFLEATLREHPQAWLSVQNFFTDVVLHALEEQEYSREELLTRIKLLEKSLCGDPVLVSVCADLSGVAVVAQPVELRIGQISFRLRALSREDIETEQPVEFSGRIDLRRQRPTSAILKIEYPAQNASGWQPELERALAILRLFGVGDVRYTAVEFGSESYAEISSGMLFLDDHTRRPRIYCVEDRDRDRLCHFWSVMASAIPRSFYWESPESPQGIAATYLWYNRILAGGGWVNPQIAEVVRALESLLMRREVSQRISRTLPERVATLLGACGQNAVEVGKTVAFAYEVRSRYVHGDELNRRDEARIQRQIGGTPTIFSRCLEYLRLALVAAIAARVEKNALIAAIDAARKGDSRALDRIAASFHAALPP